jgi:MFS family permease
MKIWPFTFNILWLASMAFVLPFSVLFYQGSGFTATQIGVLTGITPLIIIISTPTWTRLADATGRHKLIMSFVIPVGINVVYIFPSLTTFAVLLLAIMVLNIFVSPIQSFADSATRFILGDKQEMYGRIRLGSTIGFGLAAFAAGILVENHGIKLAFSDLQLLCFLHI